MARYTVIVDVRQRVQYEVHASTLEAAIEHAMDEAVNNHAEAELVDAILEAD